MQLLESQTNASSLSAFGAEAVGLLCSGEFRALADRFGYALAFDREPAKAIEEDLATCLAEIQSNVFAPSNARPSATVKFFKPNATGLFAVVECPVPTENGAQLLVELIVTLAREHKHVTLEQISVAA
jgi:hypothetical protein